MLLLALYVMIQGEKRRERKKMKEDGMLDFKETVG
jgi:hypothetical protein